VIPALASAIALRTSGGFPLFNPYTTLANQALKRVKAFLTEFGMTPSSRTRVMAGSARDDPGDEWKDL